MTISRKTSWATWTMPASQRIDAVLRQVADPALDAGTMKAPPLFDQRPEWIQPLQSPASNARGDTGADAFLVPAPLAQDVNATQPLQVNLSPSAGSIREAYAIVPIAYDDEFFYIAGPPKRTDDQPVTTRLANNITMEITRLPDLSKEVPASPDSARTRLGILRAVKLGFFKIVGIPSADTGLRLPRLDYGKTAYKAVEPGSVSQGRIALLVHGFLSDTSWMVEGLLNDLRAAGYDHVLTWDYETFASPIRDTLADMASQLQAAGIARGSSRIDVIAHSMGSLVTRSLIAQSPALGMVRRALLMGPPNAGTPIARVPDVFTDFGSAFINIGFGPVSLRSVVRFLYSTVNKGLADLQPQSNFVRWLNDHPDQQTIPVTIVAGNSSVGPMANLFQRVLRGSADLFYGGPNDLVVPVASMHAVASPPFPSVAYHEFPSNHFDYLIPGTPSCGFVKNWLANP